MQTNYKLQNAYNLVNLSDNNVMFKVKSWVLDLSVFLIAQASKSSFLRAKTWQDMGQESVSQFLLVPNPRHFDVFFNSLSIMTVPLSNNTNIGKTSFFYIDLIYNW